MNPWMMAFALIGWHALADYPLQGDFLAKAKNRTAPIPGIPWESALQAHVLIHGVGVAFITQSVVLGVLESVAHWLIDDAKCRGMISFKLDQRLHYACKALWLALTPLGLP